MPHKVGSKGQVVIEKSLRDRLGIEPGWIALQAVEGDHVTLRFVPPEHARSLKGVLAGHVVRPVAAGREWDEARSAAWNEAAAQKVASDDS
jgi:AbrB family looped-hinge helix DNA binding protein